MICLIIIVLLKVHRRDTTAVQRYKYHRTGNVIIGEKFEVKSASRFACFHFVNIGVFGN